MPLCPVFIGGSGRSGTTLLASMLASHSELAAVPEFHAKRPLLRCTDRIRVPAGIDTVRRLIEQDSGFRQWGMPFESISVHDLSATEGIASILERLVRKYFRAHRIPLPTKYWIDHTPSNICESAYLLGAFPGAPDHSFGARRASSSCLSAAT